MNGNHQMRVPALFDLLLYLTLLAPAGAVSYFLWGLSIVVQRYTAYKSHGHPLPALTNFIFDMRIALLLFPAPWLVFAIGSLFRGPRSSRALLFFASSLIAWLLAVVTAAGVAFALPFMEIIRSL
jgi:hypothetical protein